MRRIAVVGAGPPGLTIAQELRRLGYDGEIRIAIQRRTRPMHLIPFGGVLVVQRIAA